MNQVEETMEETERVPRKEREEANKIPRPQAQAERMETDDIAQHGNIRETREVSMGSSRITEKGKGWGQ